MVTPQEKSELTGVKNTVDGMFVGAPPATQLLTNHEKWKVFRGERKVKIVALSHRDC
jgi:hypothetical protein